MALVVAALALLFSAGMVRWSVIQIVTLVLVCGVPIARRAVKGGIDLFEIPVFWSVWLLLIFGFGTIAQLAYPSLDPRTRGEPFMVRAYWVVLAGTLAAWVGYGLSGAFWSQRIVPSKGAAKPRHASLGVVLTMWCVGVLASLVQSRFAPFGFGFSSTDPDEWHGVSRWLQWIGTLADLRVIALVAVSIEVFASRGAQARAWQVAFVALIAWEALWGIADAMKGAILFNLALPVTICCWYARGRIPVKALVCVLLVVALVLVPGGKQYRTFLTTDEGQHADLLERVAKQGQLASGTLAEGRMSSRLSLLVKRYGERFGHIQIVATVLERGGSANAYVHHKDFLLLPALVFVPRFVWPGKPVLNYGRRFSYVFWGHQEDTISSTGPTWFGDLHIHFGTWGVIVGMLGMGFWWKGLYTWFRRRPSKLLLLIYACSLYSVSALEKDVVGTIAGASRRLILCALCGLILYRVGHVGQQDVP